QVTQLIARRVRELGVYAEILPYNTPAAVLRERRPPALIFSGGPSSIYSEGAPQLDPAIIDLGVPILGICYGLYVVAAALGGRAIPAPKREFGASKVIVEAAEGPLARFEAGAKVPVWMSHGDKIEVLPAGFRNVGHTHHCEHAAIYHPERGLWGVQFHPEVTH